MGGGRAPASGHNLQHGTVNSGAMTTASATGTRLAPLTLRSPACGQMRPPRIPPPPPEGHPHCMGFAGNPMQSDHGLWSMGPRAMPHSHRWGCLAVHEPRQASAPLMTTDLPVSDLLLKAMALPLVCSGAAHGQRHVRTALDAVPATVGPLYRCLDGGGGQGIVRFWGGHRQTSPPPLPPPARAAHVVVAAALAVPFSGDP